MKRCIWIGYRPARHLNPNHLLHTTPRRFDFVECLDPDCAARLGGTSPKRQLGKTEVTDKAIEN
jgi:hypothetical protein